MTTIVEHDPELVDLLRSAVGEPATVLSSPDRLEEHLQRHPEEHAVVLGPSVDDARAAVLAERQRVDRPAVGIILVRPEVDNETLTEALRSGMRDVVATRDAHGLGQALDRVRIVARAIAESAGTASARGGPGGRRGHLLTVFSTKGGVGKTLVATNLAAALTDLGQRVCVVDLDVNGGDVSLMLQLSPQHTLADLAGIAADLDTSGIQSLLVEDGAGLTILAAPVHLATPVPVEPVGQVLDTLNQLFDVVVVDTSGAFDEFALHALDHSDLLLLIGTLDIPSLKSLKLAMGTLDLLNLPRDRWRVLLNRADPKVGLTAEEFEETLGMPIVASLSSSRDVLAAVNRGELIVRCQRGHQVSKALRGLAAGLADDLGTDPVPDPDVSRRRGLRRRAGKVA
jgi:pilus assembly protein CpaE